MILGSRALRIASSLWRRGVAILMYHSVVPDPLAYADTLGDISHDEQSFRAQMELLARDYHPIRHEDVATCMRSGGGLPKRPVVVTFDDGYADNCEVAMPILDNMGIPATFYVTVDCIESGTLPWPARLRYALNKTNIGAWTDETGKTWDLLHPVMRDQFFAYGCETSSRIPCREREEFLAGLMQKMRVDEHEPGPLMMTQDQLRSLLHHGHTIGSHTMSHPNLAHVGEKEANWEIAESKRRLEKMLNTPVRHFAYPSPALSPHWNDRTMAQCAETGYESAVTTDNGLVRRGTSLLCWPRIRPTKTVEGLRWNLERAFSGLAKQ